MNLSAYKTVLYDSYVGITQIRFVGRSLQLPLSLLYKLPIVLFISYANHFTTMH